MGTHILIPWEVLRKEREENTKQELPTVVKDCPSPGNFSAIIKKLHALCS
jgi:hypothetical protein